MTIFRTVPSPLTLNDNQSEQAIRVIKYISNHAAASNLEASAILLVRCHQRSGACYQRFSPLGSNFAHGGLHLENLWDQGRHALKDARKKNGCRPQYARARSRVSKIPKSLFPSQKTCPAPCSNDLTTSSGKRLATGFPNPLLENQQRKSATKSAKNEEI